MDIHCLQNLSALNMEFLEVGNIKLDDEWVACGISSPFTRIYMVTDGVGYLRHNGNVIRMTPGNVYVIPAGFCFSYDCEPGFTKIYFHISLRLPSGYDVFDGIERILCFNDPNGIVMIKQNFSADSVLKALRIISYMSTLICRCLETKPDTEIEQYSENLKKTLAYIDNNLSCSITVTKLADAMLIPVSRIRKLFRDELGMSVGKYIDDCVLRAAEREIRETTRPIHDISDSLGYCDQFYFSRCFSQKFGMSPRQYRKIHLSQRDTLDLSSSSMSDAE